MTVTRDKKIVDDDGVTGHRVFIQQKYDESSSIELSLDGCVVLVGLLFFNSQLPALQCTFTTTVVRTRSTSRDEKQ